ncbi:TolC family protein [Marinilongibacter aquaticus]|nr:TolC family protein [Marinilongibacter aquaticus]
MCFKRIFLLILFYPLTGFSQTLSLKDAIDTGMANFNTIRAKQNYIQGAKEVVEQVKMDYLPNFNLAIQQDYGTVNGQNGPLYGFGGLGVSSSGLPLPNQTWNAAFGSLYLANVNWNFFTFGRTTQRINIAKAEVEQYKKDYEQEIFKHKVKIAAAYLNLLASQRLLLSQQKNLERAKVIHSNAAVRVKNGLLPGVDSTLAAAEVSKAKISLNQIKQQLKIQNNELANFMGIEAEDFDLDTTFIAEIPAAAVITSEVQSDSTNPILSFYLSRIAVSVNQFTLFKKEYLPTFSLWGIYQNRGSGFNSNYSTDQSSFTQNYWKGIKPVRQNYLFGVGVTWNLTTMARSSRKAAAQKWITQGLEEEYKAISLALSTQLDAANARIKYALDNYNEAPLQVLAAKQAYAQRMALYNNGLIDLVDLTQALYTLNRAETDRDVIYTNVWQALLMKAAATGDFNLFIHEF